MNNFQFVIKTVTMVMSHTSLKLHLQIRAKEQKKKSDPTYLSSGRHVLSFWAMSGHTQFHDV